MNTTNQDEIHMTTPELITAHGYKSETHHIWTEDEYCLDIHRVLPKSYQNSTYNKECYINYAFIFIICSFKKLMHLKRYFIMYLYKL